MPFPVPLSNSFPWDILLNNHLAQLIDPKVGGINIWSTRPTKGIDNLVLGLNHVGYTGYNTSTNLIERWDGKTWDILPIKTKVAGEISFLTNQEFTTDANGNQVIANPYKDDLNWLWYVPNGHGLGRPLADCPNYTGAYQDPQGSDLSRDRRYKEFYKILWHHKDAKFIPEDCPSSGDWEDDWNNGLAISVKIADWNKAPYQYWFMNINTTVI